jgi:hypothetical protein
VHLAARATCAFYWFHPLVWVAWRRLCLEAERACDDAVIQKEDGTEYAGQLISLARRMSTVQARPALGMANRSDLARRVSAILDHRQRRGRAEILAAASIVICATLAVLAIAPIHAVAQSSGVRGSSRLNRALYEAAAAGDIADMERLVRAGSDPNGRVSGDGSPLIGAARNGRLDAVRWLLDRDADPNMPVSGDGNPLIMAAREGHLQVVTLLLDRGARINQVVPGDENALIQASGRGPLETVKLLVSRGGDVNARVWVDEGRAGSGEWRTPLTMARQGGHAEVAAYLISVGARE